MLLRRIARPMLAGIFITGGIAALKDPKGHEANARPLLNKVGEIAPVEQPPDNLTMIKADAAVKIGAGTLLALGKAPRLSALALAGTLVPTTLAAHSFWEIDDPEGRQNQQIQFTKNLGLLGGLLLAAADTHGKPSLAWRARRARRSGAAAAGLMEHDVKSSVGRVGDQVSLAAGRAGDRVTDQAGRVREQASGTVDRVSGKADKAARKAAQKAGRKTGKAGAKAGGGALRNAPDLISDQFSGMTSGKSNRSARSARSARKAGHRAIGRTHKSAVKAGRVRGRIEAAV